jgi:predicted membrane protein
VNIAINVLIGLMVGYLIGIGLAAIAAFIFDLEGAARFIAIGCALLGAIVATPAANRLQNRFR